MCSTQPEQRPFALIEVGLPLGETDNLLKIILKTERTSFHASIFYQILTLRLANSDRRIILWPNLILECGVSHITLWTLAKGSIVTKSTIVNSCLDISCDK